MPDALVVINRVIAEHHDIREHIRLAGESMNDFESLFSIQRARSALSQSSIEELEQKLAQTQQALSSLEQGLNTHFHYEEKALLPLFGELLVRAFLYEHHKISSQIEEAKKNVSDSQLEGLGRQALFSKKSGILQTINGLCDAIEEHAGHEEILLNMMKKSLESQ